jgi:hypothetical protein
MRLYELFCRTGIDISAIPPLIQSSVPRHSVSTAISESKQPCLN